MSRWRTCCGAGAAGRPFLATKVWTSGRKAGIEQMERSLRRLRAERIDLLQIHNLLDWKVHLPVLREFILGHPAVTCPIPATANPRHLADNVQAGFGRLPDEALRRRLVQHLDLEPLA